MLSTARVRIESRLERPTEGRSDILTSFIHHGLSKGDLLTESLLQIVAGLDTTATALRSTMLYVISRPRVYNKPRVEIDDTVATGKAAALAIVSDAILKGLPYLLAVIREGLRIHPPVTNVDLKKVCWGGDIVVIEGKQVYLPSETDICYDAWGVHHDRKMLGDDAAHFRPERWLLDEQAD